MLKIGDFSKLARISIKMLRHYDKIGLLVSESTDSFTGYRYYSESQLPLAARIIALKDMGFGLCTIGQILKVSEEPEALRKILLVKQAELFEQTEITRQRLVLLETAIERLGKDECFMNYEVTLKVLPERTVASVRKTIPNYAEEQILWKILLEETMSMNLQPANPKCGLAIFYDNEYKDEGVDIEIQAAVVENYPDTANVKFKTVPPVLIASAVYKGSYDPITEVNQAVANWILKNGYEFDGASFCIYHVSPHEAKTPEDLVTEVCYPVRKKV